MDKEENLGKISWNLAHKKDERQSAYSKQLGKL